MVSRPRKAQAIEKLGLKLFFKKSLAQTPVVSANQAVATMRVSTREATLLDLIRHQTSIGGIEAVARIAKGFSRDLQANGLTDGWRQLPCPPCCLTKECYPKD